MRAMSVICLREPEHELRGLPGFPEEVDEALALLRRPDADVSEVLTTAFGVVDEFFTHANERILQLSFDAYRAQALSSKRETD
jgi:hypothetical protein